MFIHILINNCSNSCFQYKSKKSYNSTKTFYKILIKIGKCEKKLEDIIKTLALIYFLKVLI